MKHLFIVSLLILFGGFKLFLNSKLYHKYFKGPTWIQLNNKKI